MNIDPASQQTSFDRIAAAFKKIPQEKIPRGELWVGSKCLKKAGLEDNLSGRIKFAKRFKHDMICLSLAENGYSDPSTGYRYFTVSDFDALLDVDHLFVAAVIDGPFQRLSQKMGLMQVLTGWVVDREALLAEYEQEGKSVLNLLNSCLEHSVHGVVIADDLAGDSATFLNPLDIERFFFPFHDQAVAEIHKAQALALFHSCGNITALLPRLIASGFDGLAAIQDHANNLGILKNRYGSQLLLMGGIEGTLLEREALEPVDLEYLKNRVRELAREGGFILTSSTGLYSHRFVDRMETIYRVIYT